MSYTAVVEPRSPPPSPADSPTAEIRNNNIPIDQESVATTTIASTPPRPSLSALIKSSFSPSPLRVGELLQISSPTPSVVLSRRSSTNRFVVDECYQDLVVQRRKGKNRASPRTTTSSRRSRRQRLEKDDFVEQDNHSPVGAVTPKPRKRRQSKTKQDKLSLVAQAPPLTPFPEIDGNGDYKVGVGFDSVWEQITELVLWKNVAKSALWFGSGSMFFLSSWFSKDFNFSIVSVISQLGLLFLALSFFHDSFPKRQQDKPKKDFRLTEDDIDRAAKLILPMVNTVLAVAREIFSGEPVMTLKVAPVLLFAAKYGHLITFWRLLATGFFFSFTIPKFYSNFSNQIHEIVHSLQRRLIETWQSCPHKRIVAASAAIVCWNSCSFKTRIFAVFLSLVILRYHHQRRILCNPSETQRTEEQGMVAVK